MGVDPKTDARIVAAFDFDGTLIRGNSMTAFLRFFRGDFAWYWGLAALSPQLGAFKLGLIDNVAAKTHLLTHFLQGEQEAELYAAGERFFEEKLEKMVRPDAMARLQWHQEQGHTCVMVTASLTFWTRAFARHHQLALLATMPEVEAGRFTGRLAGANCYGQGKVDRLQAYLGPTPLATTYAYGDTRGDQEMLDWAQHPFYRHFKG